MGKDWKDMWTCLKLGASLEGKFLKKTLCLYLLDKYLLVDDVFRIYH